MRPSFAKHKAGDVPSFMFCIFIVIHKPGNARHHEKVITLFTISWGFW